MYSLCMGLRFAGYTWGEVINMATISPFIRPQFDSMPPELQEAVLNLDRKVENLNDLMNCLEQIIAQEGQTS